MRDQDNSISMDDEVKIRSELNQVLQEEEIMWAQNAKVKWLLLGDKNTTYFQMAASLCGKRNEIKSVKDSNGFWWNYGEGLEQIFVREFKLGFLVIVPLLRRYWLQ
ncbi:hypothetical protein C1H46_013703 [Malus baccata]|uniref:Uncharacterized protein n=1 Tax=Malus baccata TaxID=106549 RepID=A0A540MPE1_MALBA|nr:hypothetical protein C1H46_013703 [Malus baccata]